MDMEATGHTSGNLNRNKFSIKQHAKVVERKKVTIWESTRRYLSEEEVAFKIPASVVKNSASPASAVLLLCELRQHQLGGCLLRLLTSAAREMRTARAAAGMARLRQLPENNIDATVIATEVMLTYTPVTCLRLRASSSSSQLSGWGGFWFEKMSARY